MTPWQKRTTGLTRRMAEDMQLRNLSPKTIDAYTYHVGGFALAGSPASRHDRKHRSHRIPSCLHPNPSRP